MAEGVGSVANAASARRALRKNGAVVRVKTLEDGVAAVNTLAAEHVEVLTRRAERVAREAELAAERGRLAQLADATANLGGKSALQ